MGDSGRFIGLIGLTSPLDLGRADDSGNNCNGFGVGTVSDLDVFRMCSNLGFAWNIGRSSFLSYGDSGDSLNSVTGDSR